MTGNRDYSSAIYPYILTATTRLRLIKQGFSLVCCRCGKELEDGEGIVRKMRPQNTRYYCQGCWNSLWFET